MKLPGGRGDRIKAALVLVAIAAVYFLYRRYFPDFQPEQLLGDVSDTLGAWTYLIAGLLAFLETGAFVGLIAPGETVVVLAGAIAGQGQTSVLLTIAIVWLCAFLGDTASFFIGAKLGREFVIRHGPRFRITRERFAQVESYFERHGGKTILVGRFIGLIRALAPFIAGSSGMRYAGIAPYSILGTGLWATFFTLLGYFASQNLNEVFHVAERGFFVFAVAVGVVIAIVLAVRYLRLERNRRRLAAEMERRPWLRPVLTLGRRLAPQARFVWDRLTPGHLGIEFTAPLAALAVGSFVFIAYALILGEDPGPTGFDQTVQGWVQDIRVGWLTDVAKVVTALGSTAALLVTAAAAALVLTLGRHRSELAILIVGVALILTLGPLTKELVDRPRPPDGLVSSAGSSYPSGHAAHAVIFAWLTVVATLRLRPGWSGGTLLLGAGIALTVAIGLSRVYLGVHYMSDVSGGWGLGVSAFAIATAGSVLVSHLRNNPRDDEL